MVRGTTGGHDDSSAATNGVEEGSKTTELDLARVKVDTSTHGVDDRLWLLVDLLLHEVVERALHDLGKLHLEGLDGSHRAEAVVPSQSVNVKLTLGNVGNIVVLEVQYTLGVLDYGSSVRSNEVLDRLGKTVLGQESTRLRTKELVVGVRNRERTRTGGLPPGAQEDQHHRSWSRQQHRRPLRQQSRP